MSGRGLRSAKVGDDGDVLRSAHEEEVIEFGGVFERREDAIGVHVAGQARGLLLLVLDWRGSTGVNGQKAAGTTMRTASLRAYMGDCLT